MHGQSAEQGNLRNDNVCVATHYLKKFASANLGVGAARFRFDLEVLQGILDASGAYFSVVIDFIFFIFR